MLVLDASTRFEKFEPHGRPSPCRLSGLLCLAGLLSSWCITSYSSSCRSIASFLIIINTAAFGPTYCLDLFSILQGYCRSMLTRPLRNLGQANGCGTVKSEYSLQHITGARGATCGMLHSGQSPNALEQTLLYVVSHLHSRSQLEAGKVNEAVRE
ncbi:uncharacterized protein BDZ99DRAFT_308204 [Mytilinidion resinicola]|uniref:Uncharacterized protein n=1 Tax=Mytilinidion resinicola TaxID=574789 RepID=A0A6A6YMZ1_9PEZI|nr:uncharacterized protein BDZ99DRAFT_308204 [Mytilinidion resinicola]KAF2810256.1 hypothetical protein BDZ99DRAFT_308204 [Mytilinidion resinicola]